MFDWLLILTDTFQQVTWIFKTVNIYIEVNQTNKAICLEYKKMPWSNVIVTSDNKVQFFSWYNSFPFSDIVTHNDTPNNNTTCYWISSFCSKPTGLIYNDWIQILAIFTIQTSFFRFAYSDNISAGLWQKVTCSSSKNHFVI